MRRVLRIKNLPKIIQGGMGAGVSSWYLANTVANLGQLGVVSGTAIELIVARRLQDGDEGGHMRRALAAFPFPEMAQKVQDAYFVEGGKAPDKAYKSIPMHNMEGPRWIRELTIVGNFVEVWLAKEGHDYPI
ncbi:MAG: nitronate monooxygenase, partial [Candidatus Lindowbacteria bacterium]|nr:nitronate monooxygenase [Candidatus Lindowbacteria bacterium]